MTAGRNDLFLLWKQGRTVEVRVGGSIRAFSDVSEVSKDCNLTFGQSLPELSSAPIGNNIPYILRRWALLFQRQGCFVW